MLLRRIVLMTFGFVTAAGVGSIFLVVAAFFDPATREAGFSATVAGIFAIVDESLAGGDPGDAFLSLTHVIWAIIIATCAAPLAIAALIGEIAGVRSFVWYSGMSAVLAGASPWIARAAKGLTLAPSANPVESRIALLFFLTGALTGALYWLIAAPTAPVAASPPFGPPDKPHLGPPRKS